MLFLIDFVGVLDYLVGFALFAGFFIGFSCLVCCLIGLSLIFGFGFVLFVDAFA